MKGKILFVASVMEHIIAFHLPYLEWFKSQGYEVHVAAKAEKGFFSDVIDVFHDIDFKRTPYSLGNISAYKKLKSIINTNHYSIIHCHTPMASVLTRLAGIGTRKQGSKMLYTAHGFHFYKNGPISGWMLYYPIEKFLSYFTDAIITINEEDFEALHKYKFKCGGKYLVPGIGVNTAPIKISTPELKSKLRREYGYDEDAFILFYAAEFIYRKNHKLIIESIPYLKDAIPNLKVVLAGRGELLDECIELAEKLNIRKYVDFLGFRRDIPKLVALSDVGVSSSRQEGLGITLAEDMFAGLPVVATKDRGHNEMIVDGYNGFFFGQDNKEEFCDRILKLYNSSELRHLMGNNALLSIQKFSIENSLKEHINIYRKYL